MPTEPPKEDLGSVTIAQLEKLTAMAKQWEERAKKAESWALKQKAKWMALGLSGGAFVSELIDRFFS